MRTLLGLFLLSSLCLTGCNPYTNFYKPVDNGVAGVDYDLCDEPEVKKMDKVQDLQAVMFKKGYILIGYSAFNTEEIPESMLQKQAKDVHACVTIIQKEYTHTESGFVPVTQYHQGQQVTLNTSGTATGNATYTNTYGNPVGNRTTNYDYGSRTTVTTPDYTTTTYVPYQKRMNDYLASFWAKLKRFPMGFLPDTISDETRLKLNIEKGFLIRSIREGSPADKSGFIPGDIVVGYNGGPYVSDEECVKYLKSNYGKKATLTVRRMDKELTKELNLESLGE